MVKAWWNIGMLAAEAQEVMWLRCMRLAAGGPTASAEAQRMVTEKFAAAASAAAGILMGNSADKVVKHYRRKVRANKRRLSNEGAQGISMSPHNIPLMSLLSGPSVISLRAAIRSLSERSGH